jgi:hypothetical protein
MKNILIALVLSLVLCQCQLFQKEEPGLPPETQFGKRTLGCKVNGEVWLPEGYIIWATGGVSRVNIYQDNSGYFFLSAVRRRESSIHLSVQPVSGTGRYKLRADYYSKDNGTFETDSLRTGMLTFTKFEPQRSVFSGTFYFDAYNKKTGKVVKITEGRFDGTRGDW